MPAGEMGVQSRRGETDRAPPRPYAYASHFHVTMFGASRGVGSV